MPSATGRTSRAANTAISRYSRLAVPPADVVLTIAAASHATSQLENGYSHVRSEIRGSATTAKTRARGYIDDAVTWYNSHIYQFETGLIVNWTGDGSPSGPNGTYLRGDIVGGVPAGTPAFENGLSGNLDVGYAVGGKHMVTFFGIPWFYRGDSTYVSGSVAGGNLVQTFVAGDSSWEWGDDASRGRLRTDSITQWQNLVKNICLEVMPARSGDNPYGVSCRWFQVGNEFKGFTKRTRDSKGQAHDHDDHPGTAGQADMGYTAFYKYTLEAILDAATQLGISHSTIKVGGPYPVMASEGLADADAITANRTDATGATVDYSAVIGKSWGYLTKAAAEDVDEFLRICARDGIKVDFLATDFGTFLNDRNTKNPDDWFVAYQKYIDILTWIRQRLVARGFGASFPIVLSEWYTKPQTSVGASGMDHYYGALKAMSYKAMLEKGVTIPLMWGPFGDGDQVHKYADGSYADFSDPGKWQGGLITQITSNTAGGEKQAHTDVAKVIKDHFGPGTQLYAVTANHANRADGLATPTHCMVINKLNESQDVIIKSAAGATLATDTLTPYEVKAIPLA